MLYSYLITVTSNPTCLVKTTQEMAQQIHLFFAHEHIIELLRAIGLLRIADAVEHSPLSEETS